MVRSMELRYPPNLRVQGFYIEDCAHQRAEAHKSSISTPTNLPGPRFCTRALKFPVRGTFKRVAFLNCRTKRSRNVLFWDRKTEALRTFSLLSLADRLRCYLYYYPISEFCSFSDWFSSTQFPNTFSLASFQYQPATCHNLKNCSGFVKGVTKGGPYFYSLRCT